MARRSPRRRSKVLVKPKTQRVPVLITPSGAALERLLVESRRRIAGQSGTSFDGYGRRVSTIFAAELRKRGWLHEEGYAPGSWAAP